MKDFNCSKMGHIARNCRAPSRNKDNNHREVTCGKEGHYAKTCRLPRKVRSGKEVAAPPGGYRGAAWDKTNQQQKQKSRDQSQGMSGAGEYRCGCDLPRDISAPLLFLSLQHGMLEQQSFQNCKSHLNHSFNALALRCTKLDERIRQVCREELSVKEIIQDRKKENL